MAQEKTAIRVSVKLCKRVEDSYRDGWLVDLPDDTKYAGYQMYMSSYFMSSDVHYVDKTKHYLCIIQGKQDFCYELYKKEREPGKRYPRFRLTFDELSEVYSAHSAQFYNTLPYVLAYCKEYANNNRLSAGSVLSRYYCVGTVDDTWLYESDTKRRRLGTHGVQILKRLSPSEVESMYHLLERKSELETKISVFGIGRPDAIQWDEKRIEKHLSKDAYNEIQQRISEINEIIDAELKTAKKELADIDTYLTSLLQAENKKEKK